jgi:hypothetical protein
MIEQGITDFGLAKRKAAERLSAGNRVQLPSNSLIEECLARRQRIFEPDSHRQRLLDLRGTALALMRGLRPFSPRLVGPVLSGTATIGSAIELHLFAPAIEQVVAVISELARTPTACERRFRFGGGKTLVVPGLRFSYAAEQFIVYVFAENGLREAPLSHVDQRPMQRVSVARVEQLLAGAPPEVSLPAC